MNDNDNNLTAGDVVYTVRDYFTDKVVAKLPYEQARQMVNDGYAVSGTHKFYIWHLDTAYSQVRARPTKVTNLEPAAVETVENTHNAMLDQLGLM